MALWERLDPCRNSRDSSGKDTMAELEIYLRREADPERWPKLCKIAEASRYKNMQGTLNSKLFLEVWVS